VKGWRCEVLWQWAGRENLHPFSWQEWTGAHWESRRTGPGYESARPEIPPSLVERQGWDLSARNQTVEKPISCLDEIEFCDRKGHVERDDAPR